MRGDKCTIYGGEVSFLSNNKSLYADHIVDLNKMIPDNRVTEAEFLTSNMWNTKDLNSIFKYLKEKGWII
jgi:hypothetical protein